MSLATIDRPRPWGCAALPGVLRALGLAGVELAPDPRDAGRLRFKCAGGTAALPPEHRDALARHKPDLLALLAGEGIDGDGEAGYVLSERLGIAEGLAMLVHPGSPAWMLAVAEFLEC